MGANKTVTGSGFTKSGTDAGNYAFANPQGTTTASILAWNALGYGFYPPVGADAAHSIFTAAPASPPTAKPSTMEWNTIKGGQTVPLKFNVYAGAVEQKTLAAFGNPAFQTALLNSCSDTTNEDPVDFTTTGIDHAAVRRITVDPKLADAEIRRGHLLPHMGHIRRRLHTRGVLQSQEVVGRADEA